MKITANWRTALVSGLWTGLGALLFEFFVVHGGVKQENFPYYFFAGSVPFFFVPVFLFVFGSSDGHVIKNIGQSLGRGLCWMLGAAVVLMIGLPIVGG